MSFSFEGRSTDKGAYSDAEVIRPDGTVYEPDETIPSGTGNHWTSEWSGDVSNCLILVTDFSNSGKDNSRFESPPKLTQKQTVRLEKFQEEHR